jgi:uncharacterized protein (TIGR00266 family)
MADVIDYKIYGGEMQVVEIELDPQEGVRAEAGAMMYMEDYIQMQTNMSGGLFGGFKRMLTSESFFITTFLNTGKGKSRVAFAAPFPGKILPIDLTNYGGTFICQKDSFLCAANGIDIDIAFTKKLGTGFFGGEGFILQKLTGDGLAFIHAGGGIIERTLAPGERLRIDTGCLVGFESNVNYDIEFVGGFKNALFGKEGLFLATLTGPGKVYLQSLPISKLAERILASAGTRAESGSGNKVVSGILGGLFNE